jgi:hypothetical protein
MIAPLEADRCRTTTASAQLCLDYQRTVAALAAASECDAEPIITALWSLQARGLLAIYEWQGEVRLRFLCAPVVFAEALLAELAEDRAPVGEEVAHG